MTVQATPPGDVPAEELAFNFRSGRLCLAFVATVGERWRGNYERLRRPSDLTRWCREAGLLDAPMTITSRELEEARDLREAIYRQAQAVISGRQAARGDEALINSAAGAPPLVPVLRSGRVHLTLPSGGSGQAALSTLARDAIDLFGSSAHERIRECASPECALLFVDTSRPGKRRWCSSTACGGKERAAAYRRRKRTEPDGGGPEA
ncbi:CGNR zinc finger domain-containing protein [Microtetraspora malaysiensis]|uniref:CGNR zinc finger domain-containing protein n=1 Tax=Microtetraspora malaysiensis TaxID=161358 RepID=UPI003D8FE9ED